MSGYKIRTRRDRDGMGREIIEYVRREVICKGIKGFETTICSELVISKIKWVCMCIYPPPNYNNLPNFLTK